jgi:acyl-CoA reductase-like NAD-dependent aldehyde dehydrogenase
MRSYPLHIGGADCEGSGWTYVVKVDELIRDPRRAFRVKRALELGEEIDPAQASIVAGRCAIGTDADNRRALEAAAAASKPLAQMPVATRRRMGVVFHERLCARVDELVDVLIAEGHPRHVAERETDGIVHSCSPDNLAWTFAQLSQRFEDGDRSVLLTRKPDGVVCVNPPQNAPTANAALGLVALLAGNALVVKAPKTAPLGVMYLFREIALPVLEEYDAPPGSVNLVCGYSKQILRTWVESPLADDVMFFGDSRVGLRFAQECIAHGRKPILELSGNDAFVVWRDADLDRAAELLTESFYGSSQICMVPKQAVLHPAIADELIARFLVEVERIRPAYMNEPGALLSPVLKMDRFFDYLSQARQRGAAVLCGGSRVGVDGAEALDGLFLEPTVVRVDGLAGARELHCVAEETFFPLLPLIVAEDDGDDDEALLVRMVDWCNANPYGLRNSIWARDPAVVDAFAVGLRNGGLLIFNDSHLSVAPCLSTHGGTGLSGGPFGELHYPALRTSHLQGITFGRDPVAAGARPLDASAHEA